jgi:hypothetical protein
MLYISLFAVFLNAERYSASAVIATVDTNTAAIAAEPSPAAVK